MAWIGRGLSRSTTTVSVAELEFWTLHLGRLNGQPFRRAQVRARRQRDTDAGWHGRGAVLTAPHTATNTSRDIGILEVARRNLPGTIAVACISSALSIGIKVCGTFSTEAMAEGSKVRELLATCNGSRQILHPLLTELSIYRRVDVIRGQFTNRAPAARTRRERKHAQERARVWVCVFGVYFVFVRARMWACVHELSAQERTRARARAWTSGPASCVTQPSLYPPHPTPPAAPAIPAALAGSSSARSPGGGRQMPQPARRRRRRRRRVASGRRAEARRRGAVRGGRCRETQRVKEWRRDDGREGGREEIGG